MTSSMTAFSRQQLEMDWGSLTWEIRSVNHRYLEVSVRLPDTLRGLENAVREALKKRLKRGKVECQLRLQTGDAATSELKLDAALVRKLVQAHVEVEQLTGTSSQLASIDVLRWPGVIQEQAVADERLEKEVITLFNAAVEDLVATRQREGKSLEGFVLQRIDSVRDIVASIRKMMPDILAAQKQTLKERLADLQVELEQPRLEQEIALLAQKADVDEELDRLDSHLSEVRRVVGASGQKGRRLDFLMQELNREANTLSSKSIVVDTTMGAVELKVLIEQMREQIQNIE